MFGAADTRPVPNGTPLPPIYMYAGGKTRLLERYAAIWPDMGSFANYVDPFFGGGAVWGWMVGTNPHLHTYVGDINKELVGLLRAIALDTSNFENQVERLLAQYLPLAKEDRKAWYYQLRAKYWTKPDPATLFVLMRLSFNGIWQTCHDSQGLFGTPAGLLNHTTRNQICTPARIRDWAGHLGRAEVIHPGGYETLPFPNGPETLVYLDPPYRDSYTTYGTGFADKDQRVLTTWIRETIAKGTRVILANRCVEGDTFFEDLLDPLCKFHYFDVTYTAGRRKRTATGHAAKPAREFVAISRT